MTLTTPAILFSTVSLLYVAYTNRFVAISNLIRSLKARYLQTKDADILKQLSNLRLRVMLIRNMQLTGIVSLILSVVSIILIFTGHMYYANFVFGISLLFLVYSMSLAAREIFISVESLKIELSSMQDLHDNHQDDSLLISHNFKKITQATKDLFESKEEQPVKSDKPDEKE